MRKIEDWIEEITDHTYYLHHKLHLLEVFLKIFETNESIQEVNGIFYSQVRQSMIDDLVITIGRLCDETGRTDSIAKLIDHVKNKRYELLRRERFLENYDSSKITMGERHFDRLAGEEDAKQYPKDRLGHLKRRLTSEQPLRKVLYYRHNYIAHLSRDERKPPTYEELKECFEVIRDVVDELNQLLIAKGHLFFTPQLGLDWLEIFEDPWINEENREEIYSEEYNYINSEMREDSV